MHLGNCEHGNVTNCFECAEQRIAELEAAIKAGNVGIYLSETDADDEWVHVPKWWLVKMREVSKGVVRNAEHRDPDTGYTEVPNDDIDAMKKLLE